MVMTFNGWCSAVSHRRALNVWVCVCVREKERKALLLLLLLLTWKPVYILKLNVSVMMATSQRRSVYVSKACTHSFIYSVCMHVSVSVCVPASQAAGLWVIWWKRKASGCVLAQSLESASKHPAGLQLPVHCPVLWFFIPLLEPCCKYSDPVILL